MFFCVLMKSFEYCGSCSLSLPFWVIKPLQKNGGSGGIQAQIPNCNVYIGIAA